MIIRLLLGMLLLGSAAAAYAADAVTLTLLHQNGAPVAGGRVFAYRGLTRVSAAESDRAGNVSVDVEDGETLDVFILPRNGSFAIVKLEAGTPLMVVRIPPAASRIALRTRSTLERPIPHVPIAVRFNGRMLPPEVLEALHGRRTRSDSRGRITFRAVPTGVYEFWGFASDVELRAIAAGVATAAPVKIAAAPGDNTAVLTFVATP